MTSPSSPFHIFGIRHHGPGCARTLVHALDALQPDCILVEGPPEANAMLEHMVHEQMQPPVALLVHAEDDASESVFYPFAEFSPEWQALRWALKKGVQARFMDLPVANSLAIRREMSARENDAVDPSGQPEENTSLSLFDAADAVSLDPQDDHTHDGDPLGFLARAAGYTDGEAWWNHMVEERGNAQDLFLAIAEAMRALRDDMPEGLQKNGDSLRREMLREAHMRQTMRQAVKEGFTRIAVVCGAWHLPALEKDIPAKADAALLKGLSKVKATATWVPWTYSHLSNTSGYGAGIQSPGWYEHLWLHDPTKSPRSVGWLARVAQLLRSKDIDCSSAHIIEASRLADTIATMRGRPAPSLEELNEAVVSVIFMGNAAPLKLIEAELTVGDRIGRVPDTVPMVPLQQDIEEAQKRLRLKPQAFSKIQELDLRNETDLARSQMLHRMQILGIHWGKPKGSGNTRGTFKEVWELQWQPEFSVAIIEASHWGVSLENAASAKLVHECLRVEELSELAESVNRVLLADLQAAVGPVTSALEDRASLTGDVGQLLAAIGPLANIHRYGSVRNFDTQVVERVLDGVIIRAGIGLLSACSGIAEDVAQTLRGHVLGAHAAIVLRQNADLSAGWSRALGFVARAQTANSLLRGMACRLMFDENTFDAEEVSHQLSLNLSIASDALQASLWLDGFLNRNAMVLLHDAAVWGLVNDWVSALSADHFVSVLPLIRRTFSAFDRSDLHSLGKLAARGAAAQVRVQPAAHWNAQRAAQAVPVLSQIFGVSA